MKYIAQRPGAEKHGEHGLFGQQNSVDLNAALNELQSHQGNVWTIIYSLRREDAARLGYDSAAGWRSLLLAHQTQLAEAMKIPPNQLHWYAAYHDAGHHPHIHMMIWADDPKQGYDWQQFNRERQYLQRWTENVNAMNEQRIEAPTFFCYTVDRMLDEIDNYQLYEALSSEDPLTLKMVLMRIEGYTGKMIGQVMGVSEQLVNNRISRFRKKYKKFLKA